MDVHLNVPLDSNGDGDLHKQDQSNFERVNNDKIDYVEQETSHHEDVSIDLLSWRQEEDEGKLE